MQPTDFIAPFPGTLTPAGDGLHAFVPDALLEVLNIPSHLQIRANLAEKAIGRLSGMMIGGGTPLEFSSLC